MNIYEHENSVLAYLSLETAPLSTKIFYNYLA